ncbi:MAG: SBBP repeat-containing protein, partial [Methylococcales bacterium]|nr:SBBP repeat-containing protein [Methylococcales bacterium]
MNKQHKWTKLPAWLLGLIAFAVFCNAATANGVEAQTKPDATTKARLEESYGKLPLSFEANRGQTDKQVRFVSRGQGYGLFLTPTEAVLSLHKAKPAGTKAGKSSGLKSPVPIGKTPGKSVQSGLEKTATLRMKLVGGNPNPHIQGLDELPGKVNYFRGKDPKQWQTNVPTYAKAKYENVYPGIDLVYYGNQRQLEYDFIVAAGADPKAVRLSFEGADKVAIDALGDLVLQTAGGDVRLHKPVVYQTLGGQRRDVDGRFVLYDAAHGNRHGKRTSPQIGFQVAAYDATQPLVIDPVLAYSTYLGGSGRDNIGIDVVGNFIAVDSVGNAYVTGVTDSAGFPTVNAKYPHLKGASDAFVTKFNATGSQVLYSTYLGGNSLDNGSGITVDSVGNAYVTGVTYSADFPTVNAKYPHLVGGSDADAFVTKFNATGSQVLYSTYLGGSSRDNGSGIAVDSAGNAYVTGVTYSADFPIVNAKYPHLGGDSDDFVTKFNATGSQVL